MTDSLQLEVAYARPERQLIVKLSLPAGTTAREAVLQSGIASEFLDIDLTQLKLGVFGKAVPAEHVLRDRDRVEIYRPLQADPKEVRRRRAEAGKAE
jgi:hypothetical protein